MNNEQQPMKEEKDNVPFPPYIPSSSADPAFAATYDARFDPYSYALPSWTPSTSAPPLPYYQEPVDAGHGYQDMTIFERRFYATNNLNVSCSDPMNLSATQYTLPSASFDTPMWSPNVSSGRGGGEGSMEYFTSPLGTGTLSVEESISASPMGSGQDWAANMAPMDTAYSMGSSGRLSMVDNYGPGLDEGGMFAEESVDPVQQMPSLAGERGDVRTAPCGQSVEIVKATAPPHPQSSKPDSSGRRKSSSGSKETSRTTVKKERKKKPSLGQDSQPSPVQGPRLRTAARRHGSETGHLPKPGESPEDQRARTSHNKVEKEYRNRLNREFELVIGVLPPNQAARGQSSRGKMSKADVIGSATATIQSLADEVVQLRERKRQLDEKKKKKLEDAQSS